MEKEVYSIYLLIFEDNKYYVGKTNNIDRRYAEHLSGIGACWTKKFNLIEMKVLKEIAEMGDEDKFTILMMIKYGINNVRGGVYSNLRFEKS